MVRLSDHLCECGCGERTTLITQTSAARGRVKGEPNRFVLGHGRGWKHPNPPPKVPEEIRRETARARRERRRRAYAEDPERFLATSRIARQQNPEADRARSRRWYQANREKVLASRPEYRRRWYAENRERVLAATRARQPEMREAKRLRQMTRRARKRGAFVEEVSPFIVLERDDGVCGICGGDVDPTDFHVDHVVALASGGEHSYANVQAAHPVCNMRKGWSS